MREFITLTEEEMETIKDRLSSQNRLLTEIWLLADGWSHASGQTRAYGRILLNLFNNHSESVKFSLNQTTDS